MTESTVVEALAGERPDGALSARAAAGDQAAFDTLLEPRLDRLYRTAIAILRHEADAGDAVQDTCLRAWRELPRLRDQDRFDAWLSRILVNTCRDKLRSRRRTSVREIDVAAITDSRADPSLRSTGLAERVAEIDSVRRAFVRLKADERVLLALHHAEQRPLEEIAGLVGAPLGTVKRRLYEARTALARALERER